MAPLHHVTLVAPAASHAPPIIALHGGLGCDLGALRPWLDPLAALAPLTYADLLGCGRSPEPDDWGAVTHATWADSVEALRRHLHAQHGGHERVVVFGHSYGAVIALETARRHAGRVAGLILCAPVTAGAHMAAAIERAAAYAETLGPRVRDALAAALAAPPPDDAAYAALMRDLLPVYFAEPRRHDLAAYADGIRFRAAPSRRSFYELLGTYDARPYLAEIVAPTLVLAGRHDWVTTPDEAPADLARGLPDATVHVFEQSGHQPFMEEPEALRAVVAEWLTERFVGAAV